MALSRKKKIIIGVVVAVVLIIVFKKANHFSAKPLPQPTHHSQPHIGTKGTPALSNVTVLLCFFVAKLLINWACSRLLFDETV